jgi:uncharacterized membrane protein YkvA (DUF1232 family)
MDQDQRPVPVQSDDTGAFLAWFQDGVRQFRLAWRLFLDQRVPVWTKVIPPVALGYVLFPFDIITDLAPGLGQLDDIAVVLIGLKLFVELSPPDVVREHLRELGARIQEWRVEDEAEEPPIVIEGEYALKEPEPEEPEIVEGEEA